VVGRIALTWTGRWGQRHGLPLGILALLGVRKKPILKLGPNGLWAVRDFQDPVFQPPSGSLGWKWGASLQKKFRRLKGGWGPGLSQWDSHPCIHACDGHFVKENVGDRQWGIRHSHFCYAPANTFRIQCGFYIGCIFIHSQVFIHSVSLLWTYCVLSSEQWTIPALAGLG
jgi:hypothetical protein